jgi:hypothetical protein
MKTLNNNTIQENKRAFLATCNGATVKETDKTLYKFCYMFGPKTLIFWKDTGRISIRTRFNDKGLN